MSDNDSDDDLETLRSSAAALECIRSAAGEGLPASLRNFVYHHEKDTAKFKRSLALQFVTNKKHTASVFAMMYGTSEFGKVILGYPFNGTRKKEYTDAFQPTLDMLKKEVQRRAHFLLNGVPELELLEPGSTNPLHQGRAAKAPATSNMRMKDLQEWLRICEFKVNPQDKAFLTYMVDKEKALLTDCLKADAGDQGGDSNESHWQRTGCQNLAYRCRVVEVFTCDAMREHVMTRDDVLASRLALDARSTDSEPKSGWQIMCDYFNNEEISFKSVKLNDEWGIYWGQRYDLSWDYLHKYQCPKIQDGAAFKKMYCQWNTILFQIVDNWVGSGNGEEMLAKDIEIDGDADNDISQLQTQGGDRLNFLSNRHPVNMYLWFQLLATGLFQVSQSALNTGVLGSRCPRVSRRGDDSSVGSDGTSNSSKGGPSAAKRARVMEDSIQQQTKITALLKQSMELGRLESSRSNLYLRLSGLEGALAEKQNMVNDLKLKSILERDTSVQAQINELGNAVQKQLDTQQMEVESVKSQIRDLNQQIDMANGTASTPSVSNRSVASSAGRVPMSALRTGELFPNSASAAGNSKSDDDDDADDADDTYYANNDIFDD
jgi:hypothetical protein